MIRMRVFLFVSDKLFLSVNVSILIGEIEFNRPLEFDA